MKNDIYLRVRQVSERTGLSRATIYNMMKSGTFPMKTALGTRAIGWLESEISLWMASRKSVEKVGLEAKPNPAGKRKARMRVAAGLVISAEEACLNHSGSWDGWEDGPAPSPAEMETVRSGLRNLSDKMKAKQASSGRQASAVRKAPTVRAGHSLKVGIKSKA